MHYRSGFAYRYRFTLLLCIRVDLLSLLPTVTICVHNDVSVEVIFRAIYVTFGDVTVL